MLASFTLACSEGVPADVAGPVAALERLPLSGKTAGGRRWRLEAGHAGKDEAVPTSWCLKLEYTKDVVVDGNPLVGGAKTCGPRLAPRVSGIVAIDCARQSVFVFGGARSGVGSLAVRTRSGALVRARRAELPRWSRFKGYAFMLVGDVRRLPARVEASGAGERVLARIPGRSSVCTSLPGAPKGGEPFLEFRSRK